MLKKNLSKKLRAKFPATTPSCSMVKIGRLNDSSWNLFKPQASPGEGQSQQQKENPRVKRKGEKKFKSRKVCACLGQNVLNAIPVARTASCRVTNAFSTRLKLIWPRSSFKTTKMSKKNFWQKVPVVNGLSYHQGIWQDAVRRIHIICLLPHPWVAFSAWS